MGYKQLDLGERMMISALRIAGLQQVEIAQRLHRSPSTISREIKRNWSDTSYRATKADSKTGTRRRRSRRRSHFSPEDMALVESLIRKDLSPEQISGRLKQQGLLSISHETIYKHIWRDLAFGGSLHQHLRQDLKQRRKRNGSKDSRGRVAGKRMIEERPAAVETRDSIGHWEIDTVMGRGSKACLLTLVERKTGFLLMRKLSARTAAEVNRVVVALIRRHADKVRTITADNGTEFHGYRQIETLTGVSFYFAHPYHSWERGTNENTNGLVRQYFPKGISFARMTEQTCMDVTLKINDRPRKRLQYYSPAERFFVPHKVAV